MHKSFLTRHVAVLLIFLAAPSLVEPSEPLDSELPRTSMDEGVGNPITLDQAISKALRLNLALQASEIGISAAQARLTQASQYANPEIDLEIENFGGDAELNGFDGSETTFAISQPLVLGGKIAGRKGIAEADVALADRDLDAVKLDVAATTTIAFNNVIVAQERVKLTEELSTLAKSFAQTVRLRVEAGKVSPVEGIRARAALARAQVDVAKSKRALAVARVGLATTWGSSDPRFSRAVGELLPPPTLPPRAALEELLLETPEMLRLAVELERGEQMIKLEKARGVPDLTLMVGSRKFNDTDSWAWVGGASLELPIFDGNKGARRAAEFELERARQEITARRVALEGRLATILESLRATAEEARAYEHEILPASTEAFDAMSLGFREGKFGFLEVLDAQRSLFDAALLLLDSQQRYAATLAELERLVGRQMRFAAAPSPPEAKTTQGEAQ